MQIYNSGFAKTYNLLWKGFIEGLAPRILDFINTYDGIRIRTVLDLCCGTGQLAKALAAEGYYVTGLDISPAMLEYARENNKENIKNGKVQFLEGDAVDFTLPHKVDCVISTFDSLNHLEDLEALQNCFISAYHACSSGGFFLFDLNTRKGLENWNGMQVTPKPNSVVITSGVVDEVGGKAYTRISAFIQQENGLYERVEQTAYNSMFSMADVKTALEEAGWTNTYCAAYSDLKTPIGNPEEKNRVFFITYK